MAMMDKKGKVSVTEEDMQCFIEREYTGFQGPVDNTSEMILRRTKNLHTALCDLIAFGLTLGCQGPDEIDMVILTAGAPEV